jgi:hypothetical protein
MIGREELDETIGRPSRMQTIVRAVGLAVSLAFVVACGSDGSVPLPVALGPLLTVETRGGECFNAPCEATITVERDGTVHSAAKPPNDLGTVPADQLAALDTAIRLTDFAVLKSHSFTGQCPTAFDGQELIFEFGAPGGTERIATCEVDVDYGSPLFIAASTALGPLLALPTT